MPTSSKTMPAPTARQAEEVRQALFPIIKNADNTENLAGVVIDLSVEAMEGEPAVRISGVVDATYSAEIIYFLNRRYSRDMFSFRCPCPGNHFCPHLGALGLNALHSLELVEGVQPSEQTRTLLDRHGLSTASLFDASSPVLATMRSRLGRDPSAEEMAFINQIAALSLSLKRSHQAIRCLKKNNPDPSNVNEGIIQFSELELVWLKFPTDVLEFWSHCALILSDRKVSVDHRFLRMADLEWAKGQAEESRRRRELVFWRERFLKLTIPTPGQKTSEVVEVRIRLKPRGRSVIECRTGSQPFSTISKHDAIGMSFYYDTEDFNYSATALALKNKLAFRNGGRTNLNLSDYADRVTLASILSHPDTAKAVCTEDARSLVFKQELVKWVVSDDPNNSSQLVIGYTYDTGEPVSEDTIILPGDSPIYLDLTAGTFAFGFPPAKDTWLATSVLLPKEALADIAVGRYFSRARIALPAGTENPHSVSFLKCVIQVHGEDGVHGKDIPEFLVVEMVARDDHGVCRAVLDTTGWRFMNGPAGNWSTDELSHYVSAFRSFDAEYQSYWGGFAQIRLALSHEAIELFLQWLQSLPGSPIVEISPELASLTKGPTEARYRLSVKQDVSEIDWFDVRVELASEDEGLTPNELQLLANANGRFIQLGKKGWRRLNILNDAGIDDKFRKLGFTPAVLNDSGEKLRYHAFQLADPEAQELLAAKSWRVVCERASHVSTPKLPEKPLGVFAELRPYQGDGFRFLSFLSHNHFGGILADDMGLGKTVQTLTWLMWLQAKGDDAFRVLVVCPKSVVPNWKLEAAKFTPTLKVCDDIKKWSVARAAEFDLLVINYAQLRLNAHDLGAIKWAAVILDEGQNIKNPQSTSAQTAYALNSSHRLVLTGTPIENRLLDLWSLMNFAQPGLLGSQASFKRLYCSKDQDQQDARLRLSNRIKHFILRRTKDQVAKDLPPRLEEEIVCELSDRQQELYNAELKRARLLVTGIKDDKEFNENRFNVLETLGRLRQICCHPALIGSPENESGKLDALFDVLEPLMSEGHKVLVFSQYVEMLKIIRGALQQRDIGHLMITGATEDRQELVEKFQSSTSQQQVFLLSLRAAGSGLNLTAASYVVLYDPWWNPAVESQAIDRTHRIGQINKVIAYRLIAKGTVEEKIRLLQQEKRRLMADVIKDGDIVSVLDLQSLRKILD